MRIAYILDFFPCLSETFVLNQLTGLITRGHTVDIYARRPEPGTGRLEAVERFNLIERTRYWRKRPRSYVTRTLKGLGLVVSALGQPRLSELRALNGFKYGQQAWSLELLYSAASHRPRQDYDIVHCHFGVWGLHGAALREIGVIGGKLVTTFHGFDVSVLPRIKGRDFYRRLFERGDLFLAVSEKWRDALIEMGAPADRTMVHRMGIDTNQFEFAERHSRSEEPFRLLTVGRLVEKKGVDDALRAVAILVEHGLAVEHTIVGDGPMRRELETLASSLNLGGQVRFLGSQASESVARLMEQSDALLAPSVTAADGDMEGIPVVLMEAMARGLPVVSTFHSGIPELVHDGVSGVLVPERSPDQLAGKVESLIRQPQRWPKLGRAAREHVEQHHDIELLNDRLVSIFHELLEPGRDPVAESGRAPIGVE